MGSMDARLAWLTLLLAVPGAAAPGAKASPSRAAGESVAVTAPPEASQEPAPPVVLDTPQALQALCAAFLPQGRLPTRGDVVGRAEAAAGRRREREAAMTRRYRVRIDAKRAAFAPYDEGEERLELAPRLVLIGLGGALRLWATEDVQLPVRAAPAAARRVLEALTEGTLALFVTFDLAERENEPPCVHVPGSRQYTLAAEPIAWEWTSRGKVLARGGEGSDRPLTSVAEGAKPRVEVGSPICEGDGGAVKDLFAGWSADLLRCYDGALARNPRLDGTLVVELRLDREGVARDVRISADSMQDGAVAACVREVAARPGYPRQPRGHCSVPLTFALEAAR